jgi:uncharacterized protein YkwD
MMQKHWTPILCGLLLIVGGLGSYGASSRAWASKSKPFISIKPSSVTVTQRSNSDQVQSLEQAVFQKINQYRKSRNLPPLSLESRVTQQAKNHSQAMANRRVRFSHDGFEQRIKAISIPYRSVAENVAYNQGVSDPAQQAVDGWLKSNGHRKNIEGNYDVTGIGVAKNSKGEYYFTQIFMKRR